MRSIDAIRAAARREQTQILSPQVPHMPTSAIKTAIILTNLGTPDDCTVAAVRRYLAEFLSDPRVVEIPQAIRLPLLYGVILPLRAPRSAKLYQKIWTREGSPLLTLTQQLAEALQRSYNEEEVIVKVAMRYGNPSLKDVLDSLPAVKNLVIVPLYPQYSGTTTGSTDEKVFNILSQWRWLPQLHFVGSYHDHPVYIKAIASQIEKHWQQQGRAQKLVFSYHGLPERNLKQGDPYYCFCHKTTRLVAEALNLSESDYQMVFQSRFGKAKWLQPYCAETLAKLASEGIKSVDIICPGFAVDCLETLEEIALLNKSIFINAGGEEYRYIPCLNDNNQHVQLMQELIKCAI